MLVTCCWLYGAAFLIATPIYPWYALAYVVIVIMAGRLEWLALWPAMYVAFIYDHEIVVQAAAYGLALVAIVVVAVLRRRSARSGDEYAVGARGFASTVSGLPLASLVCSNRSSGRRWSGCRGRNWRRRSLATRAN